MLTDFQNSLTEGLGSKFVMKLSSKIRPLLRRVSTLPCKIQGTFMAHSIANGYVFVVRSRMYMHRKQSITCNNGDINVQNLRHVECVGKK